MGLVGCGGASGVRWGCSCSAVGLVGVRVQYKLQWWVATLSLRSTGRRLGAESTRGVLWKVCPLVEVRWG